MGFSIVLICAITFSLGWTLFRTGSVYRLALVLFMSLAISGISMELIQLVIHSIPSQLGQIVTSVVFLVSTVFVNWKSSRVKLLLFSRDSVLLWASLLVTGVLVAFRLVVIKSDFSLFAGASRLLEAEDNAKWLNFTSHMAAHTGINFESGTGGGVAIVLIITASLLEVVSSLLFGGINQTLVAVDAVVLAQGLLIVIAPLALSPIVISTGKSKGTNQYSIFGLLVAAVVLVASIAAPINYGHLTLQYVILIVAFMLSVVVYPAFTGNRLLLAVVLGSGLGFVWLPLNVLALSIAFIGLVLGLLPASKSMLNRPIRLTLLLNFIATVIASVSDLKYIAGSGSTSGAPVRNLVVAEGGTMEADVPLLILGGAAVAIFAYYLSAKVSNKFNLVSKIIAVLLPLGFYLLIALYDAWSTGGGPHYGTRKMEYFTLVVLLAVLLPLCIDFLSSKVSYPNIVRGGLAVFVVLLLSSSALFPRAIAAIAPTHWPKASLEFSTEWQQSYEVKDQASQDLSSLPIGCLYEKEGKIEAGMGTPYLCTRQLVSIKGLENLSSPLIDVVLSGNTELPQSWFDSAFAMGSEVLDSNMLLINEKEQVVGKISVRKFIEQLKVAKS